MEKFLGLDLKKARYARHIITHQRHSYISYWTDFNPLNLVCINDIDSLTIPGIHEVPHAEVLQYINSILV